MLFSYSNPMDYGLGIDGGKGLRDPLVVREGEWYYLTGTRYPHFERDQGGPMDGPGTSIWRSRDLIDWEYVCDPLKRPDAELDKWYQMYFWAPELFIRNGKYYFTVNCCRNNHDAPAGGLDTLQGVALLVADQVEGPYRMLTEERPLIYENDGSIFVDDNGRTYMYTSGIYGFEVDLDNARIIGQPQRMITVSDREGAWNWEKFSGVEGPFVHKKDGVYYLFYSGWARGYEVGYATAPGPLGPWKEAGNSPLYGALDEEACNRRGIGVPKGYYANDFREAGHNSLFLGPDGRTWIAAHVFADWPYDPAHVQWAIDPLLLEGGRAEIVDPRDSRYVRGPTEGPRSVDTAHRAALPVQALDTYAYVRSGIPYVLPGKSDVLFDNGWRECMPVEWEERVIASPQGRRMIRGRVATSQGELTCHLHLQA